MSIDTAKMDATSRAAAGRSRRIRVALLLFMVALVGGIVAVEAASRVVFDRNGMHYGIEMWKYAQLVKRQSSNPAIGHEHAPNRHAHLMGVDVRTNSHGLRSPERPIERQPGVRRVLVLGDSLTFGWGVEEDATYPRVVERLLNESGRPAEVINAGVGNYNTSQQVTWFTERGLVYQPDEVVLGFYINDAEPTPRRRGSWLANRSYLYVLLSSTADASERIVGLKKGYAEYYGDLYGESNPGWRDCQAALEKLISVCRTRGIRLKVVLLPELHDVEATYPFRFVHERVAAVAKRHGGDVLDLDGAFRGHDPKTLWVSPGDAHPNARAHQIIAERLFSAMVAESR
jgi:lysophospholipase L1-like esterase